MGNGRSNTTCRFPCLFDMALLACDNAERYRLGSGSIDSLAD